MQLVAGGGDPAQEVGSQPAKGNLRLAVGKTGNCLLRDADPVGSFHQGPIDIASRSDQIDHFCDGVVGVGGRHGEEFGNPRAFGSFQGEEHRQGELAFTDIRSGRLAQVTIGGHKVECIIGDLENHTEFPRPGADRLDHLRRSVGGHRSEAGRRADQAGGLATNDPEILDRTVLQVVVDLQFQRLAFDQLGIGMGQQADRFLSEGGGSDLGSSGHQKVTGQDGDGIAPVAVDRCSSAAGHGLIDDIVVVEAPQMNQLDCGSGVDRPVVHIGTEFGGQLGQQRPEPFSAGQEPVLGDLREEGVVRLRRFDQAFLNAVEPLPDLGARDQIGEFGGVHTGLRRVRWCMVVRSGAWQVGMNHDRPSVTRRRHPEVLE